MPISSPAMVLALVTRRARVRAADLEDGLDGIGAGGGPMNMAAGRFDVPLELLQVDVQVRERMFLDALAVLPQPLEIRKLFHRRLALADETAFHPAQRLLQLGILQGVRACALNRWAVDFMRIPRFRRWPGRSPISARISATW